MKKKKALKKEKLKKKQIFFDCIFCIVSDKLYITEFVLCVCVSEHVFYENNLCITTGGHRFLVKEKINVTVSYYH